MRLEDRIKLRWVRGNDVSLRVMLTEPECDSNGVPVKNGRKQSWKAVDLDTYEQIHAKLKRMFTGFTAMDTMCGQVEEPCCYPVESGKGDADGVLIVEVPGTLPVGIYALEVTGMCDGRSMRSFETMLFGIVECNGKANATFDVIEGQKSADVDIKVQLVSSATVRGKNAYELWKEIPGNENKTLQEYLDGIVSGEAEQADWNATNPQSRAYIKNKPDVYDKSYIDDALSDIQSSLTFDNVPVSGSSNPVTSDGIKRYVDAHQPDLSGKQDVISDLAAIRSGAALGTTAVQTETDPTVPAWAKTSTKPSYTAQEVGALPNSTVIPSALSDLTNDSGFVTDSYVDNSISTALTDVVYFGDTVGSAFTPDQEGSGTEIDITDLTLDDVRDGATRRLSDYLQKTDIASWAKAASKPSYTAQEVGALPTSTAIPSALSELTDDSTHRVVTDAEKTTWNSKTANVGTVTSVAINGSNYTPNASGMVNLGTISGGGGTDTNAVHKTGNETVDGTKTLIGTLSVNDGMGGEIKSYDLNDFSWIKTANATTLQSVITALANRVTALETALNNLYSYNSSTGVLTINNPNSNS